MTRLADRRWVLKGLLGGGAVTVGLPLLDCRLNGNGTALAAGAPLPTRFGTWFWGLGVTPGRWKPTTLGADYDILPELESVAKYKSKVSILSGFDVLLDGKPNFPHQTGGPAFRCGVAPARLAFPGVSFDTIIADAIGATTRFRSIELSGIAGDDNTLSGRGPGQMNPAESSALALYTRVFGADFADPNAADFKPDPAIMAKQSVLSAVTDERRALEQQLGAADRVRLDQYFTAVRQVENQLTLQLQKPEPLLACKVPKAPPEFPVAHDVEETIHNHEILAQVLAMTLTCNQTKVFNVCINDSASSLTRAGSTTSHHQLTHDEQIDEKLGYQPEATKFIADLMKAWGTFVGILDSIPEGGGTLLDNTLVVAHSDSDFAKVHSITNLPVMFAGAAGGRIKPGVHIDGKGEAVSRLALTAMQVMKVNIDRFGTGSMDTNKPVTELFA
ncbi:MAG: DUF1552 domain-containing protein [Alphaproteobacteria bacterium]|nr:DUF1552 domain-containing protein [Alphaproteobacteria bacterium]